MDSSGRTHCEPPSRHEELCLNDTLERIEVSVDYEPGTVRDVELEDGSHVVLRKLDVDYDPTDAINALKTIHDSRVRGEFVTGLLYVDTQQQDLSERERLTRTPLAQLDEEQLRIGREEWQKLMET